MENKEKLDKIINGAAVIGIIALLAGAMVAIWIGFVGIKIMLSAIVLLVGDYLVFYWIGMMEREKRRRKHLENRRKQW